MALEAEQLLLHKNSKVLMTLFPLLSLEKELDGIALGCNEVIQTGIYLKLCLKIFK